MRQSAQILFCAVREACILEFFFCSLLGRRSRVAASLLHMPTFVLWVKAELEGVKSLSFPFPSTTWTFDVQQAAGSETREGVVMDPEEARRTATAGVLLPPLHSVVPHARGHLQRMCLRRGAAGSRAHRHKGRRRQLCAQVSGRQAAEPRQVSCAGREAQGAREAQGQPFVDGDGRTAQAAMHTHTHTER